MAEEKKIGKVTHFFSKIGVAVVDLSGELKIGENIHVKGHTSDFTQKVRSMQIEHDQVESAGKGKSIGLKVNEPVREGDLVYKVIE